MSDLLVLLRSRIEGRVGIAASTRYQALNSVDFLETTWPGFASLRPDEIKPASVVAWRDRALSIGTGYKPPGAKGVSAGTAGRSPSSFNKAVDALRAMLDLAVDANAIASNPLAGRRGLKAKLNPRKPQLPETAKLHEIFNVIEQGKERGGWPVETADFCRFLAFTGCRLREAASVCWQDVDLKRGIIRVRGTKTESAAREVPIIPAARELLDRIHERRRNAATHAVGGQPHVDPATPVLAVSEGQKSLTRACEAVGVPRLTHHDLRDAFATTCIESGIDIPTVAAWLGHADGGALLMRVYAHHRRAHSVAQAAKVAF